ncbi:MAG: hypothetical protein MUQ30_03155 [Anaerolineae bacterium]|nr:hypothetical protein [Anaerolineae bacterium]
MNSKERVGAAIRRERPDKVPLGFYVVDYDIIERVIGRPTHVRNKVKAQIAFWEGRRDEVVESYKNDTIDVYRKWKATSLRGGIRSAAGKPTISSGRDWPMRFE